MRPTASLPAGLPLGLPPAGVSGSAGPWLGSGAMLLEAAVWARCAMGSSGAVALLCGWPRELGSPRAGRAQSVKAGAPGSKWLSHCCMWVSPVTRCVSPMDSLTELGCGNYLLAGICSSPSSSPKWRRCAGPRRGRSGSGPRRALSSAAAAGLQGSHLLEAASRRLQTPPARLPRSRTSCSKVPRPRAAAGRCRAPRGRSEPTELQLQPAAAHRLRCTDSGK